MNDYPSKSQRMSWNNDGMDPDWIPDIVETKSDPIEKIKAFIKACGPIAEALRSVPEEGPTEWHWYTIKFNSKLCNDLVKAYDEVKFK